MSELIVALATVEFNEPDHCLVHYKQCAATPRLDPRYANDYWLEGSGNTCCPWSSMSDTDAWLDESTLPAFVWS